MTDGPALRADRVLQEFPLKTGDVIWFAAEELRRERTGVHAVVTIGLNGGELAHDTFNIGRDGERTRLVNSAYKALNGRAILTETFPPELAKLEFDSFCRRAWPTYVSQFAPAEVVGLETREPPSFLVDTLVIENGGTILFAPPERAKTWLGLLMAQSVNRGIQTLFSVRQVPVLFVGLERSQASYQRRLADVNEVLGLPRDEPLLMLNARGRSLDDVFEAAEKSVRERGICFGVLDSISRAGIADLNENGLATGFMDRLNRLFPTWLALAHSPRGDSSHVFGSMHFEAAADVMVKVNSERRDDTLGVVLEVIKANDFRAPPPTYLALDFASDNSGLLSARPARSTDFPQLDADRTRSLGEDIAEYLLSLERSVDDATTIADALRQDRTKVSRELTHNKRFVQVGREGKRMLYSVRSLRQEGA